MRIGAYADGVYFCKCVVCSETFHGDKHAVNCLRCAAEQLQAELDKHHWIPVEERLPPINGRYAVTDLKIWWQSWWGVNGEKGHEFGDEGEWYPLHSRTITHWKPEILPEQALKKVKP